MSCSAALRTEARARTAGPVFDTTPLACLQRVPDRGVAAGARAILDGVVGGSAGVEPLATVGARHRTTSVACHGTTRSGLELRPAHTAWAAWCYVGKLAVGYEVRVCSPKLYLRAAVTAGAERDKVCKLVCGAVVVEQVERALVVDGETVSGGATPLARMAVALAGELGLPTPVLTAVVRVPAEPGRVVPSRPVARRAPYAKAHPVAEVLDLDGAWLLLDWRPAGVASDGDATTANALPVDALPRGVALEVAEGVRGECNVVRSSLESGAALGAVDGRHAAHYNTSGRFMSGGTSHG